MAIQLIDLVDVSKEVKERCRRVAEFAPDALLDLTLFTPKEAKRLLPLLSDTIRTAYELQSLPLEGLIESKLEAIRETAKYVELRFKELKETTDTVNDRLADNSDAVRKKWDETRDNFIQALKTNCEAFLEVAYSIVPYLRLRDGGNDKQQEAQQLIAHLTDTLETTETELTNKRLDLEKIMKAARDTAAHVGVAQHATSFGVVSDKHTKLAKYWLGAAAGLTVIAVCTALLILFFYPAQGDLKNATTLQPIIGKLIAVSLLYYGALWSGKNYRTHRHLSVLNAHRQSALNTFDAFVRAASGDDQTKNAVLLEATRCIFAPANTGYLGKDDDDSQNSRIVEIFKMVGSSNK